MARRDRELVAAHVDRAQRAQLYELARSRERSVSAELRVAIRQHLLLHSAEASDDEGRKS